MPALPVEASGIDEDPYLTNLFTRLVDAREPWLPLLLEFKPDLGLGDFVSQARRWIDDGRLEIPALYRSFLERAGDDKWQLRYVTVRARFDDIRALLADPALAKVVARYEVGPAYELASQSPPLFNVLQDPASPATADVAVAVIDDGIAFAHERFRMRDGRSRLLALLDLQQHRVYGNAELTALIRAEMRNGQIDETAVYRKAGYEHFADGLRKQVNRRAAHGTHVMDLACGRSPDDCGPVPHIIAVQLPREATEQTHGATLKHAVYEALLFVVTQAALLKQPLRGLVVNLSYGVYQGPHDGSSLIEQAIDALTKLAQQIAGFPLAVVLPAGNHRLAQCHCEFELAPGETRELALRVQPDDRTDSWLELWCKVGSQRGTPTVQLLRPDGSTFPAAALVDGRQTEPTLGGDRIVLLSTTAPGDGRRLIQLKLGPTASDERAGFDTRCIPAGRWRIRLTNPGAEPVQIGGWIARDDAPMNFRRKGRQARFEDPAYRRWTLPGERSALGITAIGQPLDDDPPASAAGTRRRRTLNAFATGRSSVVVSGVRGDLGRAAPYTSLGAGAPDQPDSGVGPRPGREIDYYARCETSPARRGVLAAGTRSGSRVALGGTSVAAPQVTRVLVERVIAGRPLARPSSVEAIAEPVVTPTLSPGEAARRNPSSLPD
jgi:hypothetical protein